MDASTAQNPESLAAKLLEEWLAKQASALPKPTGLQMPASGVTPEQLDGLIAAW